MSRATELLEQATPLPWVSLVEGNANEALMVYAVNRLPDYEAAAEALERLVNSKIGPTLPAMEQAREALARLRDKESADVL